jgi:hypothetical protein
LIWVNADDQGRLCGDPEEVKYACCPNIDHISKADTPQLLDELEQNQLIKIYNTPKSTAIQILDWWNIQKPQWAWPSEYPPPEGWQDRLRYKKDAKTVVTQNWQSSPESQKNAQVRAEQPSGEDIDNAHLKSKNGSPDSPEHAQVNSLVPRAEKVLGGESPHPSLPLETEKETERGKRKRNSPEDSGEAKKGAQVSTQAAKKPPDPLTEASKQVFEALKERRRYNSPQAGAEAQAITWMLKQGYMVEQILGAYDRLKQDEFWRDKLLNMQSVKVQIGEIFRGRRQHGQHESGAGEHRRRTQNLGEWAELPEDADFSR